MFIVLYPAKYEPTCIARLQNITLADTQFSLRHHKLNDFMKRVTPIKILAHPTDKFENIQWQ